MGLVRVNDLMDRRETLIQCIAYELWEEAGKPEGRCDEFYFQAEELLRKGLSSLTAIVNPGQYSILEPLVKIVYKYL